MEVGASTEWNGRGTRCISMVLLYQAILEALLLFNTLGYHCMDSLNFINIWPYVNEVLALLLRFTSPWESYVVY